jgi:hypothetical protein
MGFLQDVASFGTNVTRQVDNAVVKYGGAIPVVGQALTAGASMQLEQLDAIDKATGNVKSSDAGFNVDSLIQTKLEQRQFNIEKEKEIANKLKKDKEKKILIYGFSSLGVILIATITYIIIKKNKK